MSDDQEANEERPCLRCQIVELIDNFFAENPVAAGEPETIDTDEVVTAVAKTVAELTSGLSAIKATTPAASAWKVTLLCCHHLDRLRVLAMASVV